MRNYKNPKKNIIGTEIRKYRIKQEKSQRQLAEQCQLNGLDINKNRISDIENQKSYISDYEIIIICNALNISVANIFECAIIQRR